MVVGIKSRFRLCRYLIITRDIGNNMWPSRELTYVMNCLLFAKKPFFYLRILALPGVFDFQFVCPGTQLICYNH